MSWTHAPLYVRAHDFARWLHAHVAAWESPRHAAFAADVAILSRELLGSVSLALTFPDRRDESREVADECVVRLRVLLRLAVDLGATTEEQLRFAAGELRDVGRMIGGWRRAARLGRGREGFRQKKGAGARAAPTASCAAAATGTTPTGAVPPTATGTTRTTGTTTSASGSPGPPPPTRRPKRRLSSRAAPEGSGVLVAPDEPTLAAPASRPRPGGGSTVRVDPPRS